MQAPHVLFTHSVPFAHCPESWQVPVLQTPATQMFPVPQSVSSALPAQAWHIALLQT